MTDQISDTKRADVDLDAIQAEQVTWSLRNFGEQPAYRPLLGIIEELCELDKACGGDAEDDNVDEEGALDALGDVAIYMLDYCGKRGWRIKEFWDAKAPLDAEAYDQAESGYLNVIPLIEKLSHHQLKGEQNIRGGAAHHDAEIKTTLSAVLWALDTAADALDQDFLSVMNAVWQKVRLRDWTKNPDTAHEVAEEAAPK